MSSVQVESDIPMEADESSKMATASVADKQYGSDSESILEDMKQLEIQKKKVTEDDTENVAYTINTPSTAPQDADGNTQNTVEIVSKPTVIEDFIRNFLISNEMHDALDVFQREWYNKLQRDDEITAIAKIPDIYIQREKLESTVKTLRSNLERMEAVTERVKNTWDGLRKERDYHRMHHRRVLQEKKELIKQLKRLKKYCDAFEPTISSLRIKYENAKKEKMLFRIDRDKMAVKLDAMEEQIRNIQENYMDHNQNTGRREKRGGHSTTRSGSMRQSMDKHAMKRTSSSSLTGTGTSRSSRSNNSKQVKGEMNTTNSLPTFSTANPFLLEEETVEPVQIEKLNLFKTLNVHQHAVSKLALHPTKDIVATTSDDMTWKLWNLPSGELIMSGEGHKDWVSAASFDPVGAHLATSSGDCTVKIWDFAKSRCVATLEDHTSVVWDVQYHFESPQFVVSCSMDHTVKLWDIEHTKCRQTYRGHVDSVNCVEFQPYSNHIVSGSGDKTISFWDCRSALCIQTFYGHRNSINHVAFNRRCDEIVSCDADGMVKIWDIRMIKERQQINSGKLVHPSSHCIFDASGKRVVVASDDAMVKVYDAETGDLLESLAGHQDSVNGVALSHSNKMLMSCSSDCTVRLWQ